MNQEITFDDYFVSGCLTDLLSLKIDSSIITDQQIAKVAKILKFSGNTVEQLQSKRNSIVKLLTEDVNDEAAKEETKTDRCA